MKRFAQLQKSTAKLSLKTTKKITGPASLFMFFPHQLYSEPIA